MTEAPRSDPGLFDLPLEAPPPAPPRSDPHPETDSALERSEEPGAESLRENRPESDLEGAAESASSARRRAPRSLSRPETLPLFDTDSFGEPQREQRSAAERPEPRGVASEHGRSRVSSHRAGPIALPDPPPAPAVAPLAARLWGTGGDLVIVAATGALAALGARWLGAPIGLEQLLPLTLFLLAWSFVYFVVPLAFWGATPGMSWAGLVARTSSSEPLSFGQAALRWLGTWLSWATLGVGGLLALSGRSLVDRISGSSTYPIANALATASR